MPAGKTFRRRKADSEEEEEDELVAEEVRWVPVRGLKYWGGGGEVGKEAFCFCCSFFIKFISQVFKWCSRLLLIVSSVLWLCSSLKLEEAKEVQSLRRRPNGVR